MVRGSCDYGRMVKELHAASFEDEGKAMNPEMSLLKAGKDKEMVFSWSLLEGMQPANVLIFAQRDPSDF